MVLPADYVADLHGVVVCNHGEVVGGDAVGADDDEIADRLALEGHRPADEVLEGDRSWLNAETPDGLTSLRAELPLSGPPRARGTFPGSAASTAARRARPARPPAPPRCSSRGRPFPAAIRRSRQIAVEIETFGLVVGTVRAAHPRPLVPVDPQPLQFIEEILLEGLGRPGPVGILDAQHKDAAVMPREKPVEKGRPRVADVELPRRRGGESNPDRWRAHADSPPSRETTAKAAAPSPAPTSPIPSLVLAFTLTCVEGIPRTRAIFSAISPR